MKKATKKTTHRRRAADQTEQVRLRVRSGTGEALRAALSTPEGEARLTDFIQQALKDPATLRRYIQPCRADFSDMRAPTPSPAEEELQKRIAGLVEDLRIARAENAAMRAQIDTLRVELARTMGYIDRVNEGQPEVLPMVVRRGPKVSVS